MEARVSLSLLLLASANVIAVSSMQAERLSELEPLSLVWLNNTGEEQARCMDGSPYGFYYRPATDPANATKWVVELQGGGWCYNEGACYGRTLPSYAGGVFGSSNNWTSTMTGYFLEYQSWNRVFLRYCSGASFTGYRREP